MRNFNLRWLAGLLVGSIIFGGLSFLLHRFQMGRNASVFLREAKRAQAADRPFDAVNHLRRYTALAPNDTEGMILFGLQLADLGSLQPAYLTLDKAIQRQPDRADVRRRLAEIAERLGRYAEAIDQLQNHLLKDSPNDAKLRVQLSRCQSGRRDYKEAEKTLETAIASDPQYLEAYLQLASLRREKLDRGGDADTIMNQMVSSNSDDFHVYVYRAQWQLQRIGSLKESLKVNRINQSKYETEVGKLRTGAEADANTALKLAPDDTDVVFVALQSAQASERRDDIRKYAEKGLELRSSDPRFYSALAQLESTSGNPNKAIELLRRGIALQPKDLDLKWMLANLLIDVEKHTEAREVIEQLRKEKFAEALVGFLQARILVRRAEWVEAIKSLESVRSGLHQYPELEKQVELWLGIAYRETKSRDQQLSSYRRAVAVDPNSSDARLGLAEALISGNQVNEASDEYRKILSKPDAPVSAAFGLAKSLLLINAKKVAAQQNWDEFDELIHKIEAIDGASVQVATLRMERYIVQEKLDEATKVITAAREKNLDDRQLWTAQISLAQLSRDWEQVEQLLQAAEQRLGDSVNLRMLRGRYLAQRYDAEATPMLEKLSEPDPAWTQAQRVGLAGNFAPLFLAIKNVDAAIKQASIVSDAEPKNLQIRLLLLDIAVRGNRPSLMDQYLKEIGALTGEGAIWHYGEAIRLNLMVIDKEKDKEIDKQKNKEEVAKLAQSALEHLDKARVERQAWEKIPLLAAEIHERQGDLGIAVDLYLEAIRLGENSPAVTARALSLLFQKQRFEEADKLIRHLHESQNLFTDGMIRAEVDLSLQLGRKEQALKTVEQLVHNSPQGQDPIWLGKVFASLGKLERAEGFFRDAIKSNHTSSAPWVNLVQVLMQSDQLQKAEIVVDEAKSAITSDDAMLAIAQCYEIIKKPELARASYQAALEKSPDDVKTTRLWVEFLMRNGGAAEAEASLRKIAKDNMGADEGSRNNRKWAQRRLASVLVARGGREALGEALAIVDANLTEGTQRSVEDRRMKALILARGSTRAERQEAANILEKLLEHQELTTTLNDDRFLLASLYSSAGDRTKARTELRKLIAAKKDEPRYLNAYAQLSLQSGETADAELYLNALEKLVPNELSTTDLKAQVLFAKKKYSDVIELIKSIGNGIGKEVAKTESSAAIKLWAAKRLEEFAKLLTDVNKTETAAKFTSESESFYTKFVQERSDETLIFAEFLARTDQIDRALEMLQEHGLKSSVSRVGSVAIAMMRNARATVAQLTRLQDLLKANIDGREQSIPLSLVAADLMAWRGDTRGAISAYKDVLQRNGKNFIALNNLAFVLSVTGGDLTEAMRLVELANENGGPVDAIIDTRGLVQLASAHPELALADFEQANRERETAERRFHIAAALAQLKQGKLAKQSLDQADALGLSESEIHPLERGMLNRLRNLLKDVDKTK